MKRRTLIASVTALFVPSVARAEPSTEARLRDALERIALLDEADGHELTVRHAFRAVAIATDTLGKHPSQILVERYERGLYK